MLEIYSYLSDIIYSTNETIFGGFMFGIINEVKTEEKKHSDGMSYGGFGSRLAYEQFCREQRSGRAARLAKSTIVVCICLMFGMIGMVAGLLIYDMVDSHKMLYYPRGSMPESSTETTSAETERLSALAALREVKPPLGAENVTLELSNKYRIPVGVMIHRVEADSSAATAGILSGDIIVGVDGIEVRDINTLDLILTESSEPVRLMVFRNNQYFEILWDITE